MILHGLNIECSPSPGKLIPEPGYLTVIMINVKAFDFCTIFTAMVAPDNCINDILDSVTFHKSFIGRSLADYEALLGSRWP